MRVVKSCAAAHRQTYIYTRLTHVNIVICASEKGEMSGKRREGNGMIRVQRGVGRDKE